MKDKNRLKNKKRIHRHRRTRAKVSGDKDTPRLSVYKSNRHCIVQLIDDIKGKTILSVKQVKDNQEIEKVNLPEEFNSTDKKADSYKVGYFLAKKALKMNISGCVFDKGGFKYHGRIKAVANGLRDGGLKF